MNSGVKISPPFLKKKKVLLWVSV